MCNFAPALLEWLSAWLSGDHLIARQRVHTGFGGIVQDDRGSHRIGGAIAEAIEGDSGGSSLVGDKGVAGGKGN
jgi:hypothetical protein